MVRTLGTFEVLIDGVARPEGKKQPRRILALLKAIIALGVKDVCRSTLADTLWPELDGDKAQNALTVTLHRLRSYLGVPGAIPVRHGRLSLEPQHVWVDALEFETAARAVSAVSGCDSVERIFELYRGPFLSADGEEPWTMRQRERLRSRFVSIIAGAGAALEARDRPADAVTVYERGLAADDLAGVFRDGLMRALSKLGRAGRGSARAARNSPRWRGGVELEWRAATEPSAKACTRHARSRLRTGRGQAPTGALGNRLAGSARLTRGCSQRDVRERAAAKRPSHAEMAFYRRASNARRNGVLAIRRIWLKSSLGQKDFGARGLHPPGGRPVPERRQRRIQAPGRREVVLRTIGEPRLDQEQGAAWLEGRAQPARDAGRVVEAEQAGQHQDQRIVVVGKKLGRPDFESWYAWLRRRLRL